MMEPRRSYTASDDLAATMRKEPSRKTEKPLESARRRPVEMWTTRKSVAHSSTGEQKQKQRTFDVLPKPANLISYRQPMDGQRGDQAADGCGHPFGAGASAQWSSAPSTGAARCGKELCACW